MCDLSEVIESCCKMNVQWWCPVWWWNGFIFNQPGIKEIGSAILYVPTIRLRRDKCTCYKCNRVTLESITVHQEITVESVCACNFPNSIMALSIVLINLRDVSINALVNSGSTRAMMSNKLSFKTLTEFRLMFIYYYHCFRWKNL